MLSATTAAIVLAIFAHLGGASVFTETTATDASRTPPGADTSGLTAPVTNIIGGLNATFGGIERISDNDFDFYKVYLHNPSRLVLAMETTVGSFNPTLYLLSSASKAIASAVVAPVTPTTTLIAPGAARIDLFEAGLGASLTAGYYSIGMGPSHNMVKNGATVLFDVNTEESMPGNAPTVTTLAVTSVQRGTHIGAITSGNYIIDIIQAATCTGIATGVQCLGHDVASYTFAGTADSVYSMYADRWLCVNAEYATSTANPTVAKINALSVLFTGSTPAITVSVPDGTNPIDVTFDGDVVSSGGEPTFGPLRTWKHASDDSSVQMDCGIMRILNDDRSLWISVGNYSLLASAPLGDNHLNVDIWVPNRPTVFNVADGFLGQTRDGGTVVTTPSTFLVSSGNLEECTSSRFLPTATFGDPNFYCPDVQLNF